ncbi:MAG: hypothetical protein ACXABU_12605 [Candidatus Hodarchaeales archaeon]|jgi:hypothetical protein
MNKNKSINKKNDQNEYRKKILSCFERMIANSQKILSSGIELFQSERRKDFCIDAYIETIGIVVGIETRTGIKLTSHDVSSILQERFDPLSNEVAIIAIIDSDIGFDIDASENLPNDNYIILLTHQTKLVAINQKITPNIRLVEDIFKYLKIPNRENLIEKDYYKLLAFVNDGVIRKIVYKALLSRPKYAYEIAREANVSAVSVCRAITALKKNGLIKCLNPDSKRRKYNQLTSKALYLKDEIF